MLQPLWNIDDVLDVLHGPTEVGRLTGNVCAAVTNWRRERGHFPAKYYIVLKMALADEGYYGALPVMGMWGEYQQSPAGLYVPGPKRAA